MPECVKCRVPIPDGLPCPGCGFLGSFPTIGESIDALRAYMAAYRDTLRR
jgi:hypothetical protein